MGYGCEWGGVGVSGVGVVGEVMPEVIHEMLNGAIHEVTNAQIRRHPCSPPLLFSDLRPLARVEVARRNGAAAVEPKGGVGGG